MTFKPATLGTLLRHLVDLLDGTVEQSYARSGLDYRPRYTPVVRALVDLGPSSIRAISRHAGITHSAVSQTVSQMKKCGLVRMRSSGDARERIISLTTKAKVMIPALEGHWAATNCAAEALDDELSTPLSDLLREAIGALERQAFAKRIERAQARLRFRKRKKNSEMAIHKTLLMSVFALSLMAFAQVQTPTSKPARLSAVDRIAALKAIEQKFQEIYVFPEMRPKIVERLNEAQQVGRYDVDDPDLFAERVTRDLKDVALDEHLALRVDPAAYAAALAPPKSNAGEEAFLRHRAIRSHHGLAETRILFGNIRYLKITQFEWIQDETGAVYDETMRFLKDGDAVIIDLRGNGGGESAATHYLLSHFFDPGTLDYTFFAGSEPPEQSLALDYLPAGRLKGKPLYVLIDGGTCSAAEAVAYDIQQFKLGELVGTKTAGAANNNKLLPIAPNFILSISYGRPVHVISHTNWEGVGVKPDIETLPVPAFDVAQARALTRLAETPGAAPETVTEYNWARVAVEARIHPVTFAPDRLRAWAGHYGKPNVDYGELNVSFKDGALWLERPHRPPARLSPLTPDAVFAIEGSELLRARLSGKTVELLWWESPNPRVFARD